MARPSSRRPARSAPAPARATTAQARHAAGTPRGAGGSWWSRLPSRTQHLVCLALLIVVGAAFYAPAVFGGKGVVGYDTIMWRAMAASMIQAHDATGADPLWAVNPFGGMPGIMVAYFSVPPGPDTLVNALRDVLGPLAAFLLLTTGVYGLVYTLTREKLAAVLAALAFGLTTYLPIILGAGHTGKFMALSYAPWLFWAFAYALRRPGLVSGLLFAAALGVNLRAGHPQITYYAAFAIGLWWLAEGVGALRDKDAARFGKATGFLALGTVLAIGLVAHPYLLQLEYKDYTARATASAASAAADTAWTYAMAWSQGFSELLTFLVPGAFGGGGQSYFGPKPEGTAGPHYVGGLVLVLAVVGLVASRRRRAAVGLGVAALVMTLFSLGRNFEAFNRLAFDLIPYFKTFRVPETWLSMVALCVALLAGLGVAALVRADREDDPAPNADRAVRVAWMAVLVLLGVTVVLFALKGSRSYTGANEANQVASIIAQQNNVAPSDPRVTQAVQGYLAEQQPARAALYGGDLLRTLVFLLLGAALLWAYRKGRLPAWMLAFGLLLLVTVDLYGVGHRYFSGDRLADDPDPANKIEKYASDTFIEGRVQAAGGPGHFRALSLDGDPGTNARPAAFYETLGGYHGAKLRVYQDYLEHILRTPEGGLNPNALKLMGVRYIAAQGPVAPGLKEVFSEPQAPLKVYEDSTAKRAWWATDIQMVQTPSDMWAAMQAPGFDPYAEALLLPGGPSIAVNDTTAALTPADSITLVSYGPREIRYRVNTGVMRLLVLSEVYYPAGWTATVDGQATPILQVDYLLRGVQVPAGTHTVELTYNPARYKTGETVAWLSTILVYGGLALLLGLGFVQRKRREEKRGDAEPPNDDPPVA